MILGLIPSRYASTRFPGKPLAKIAGISMIERVYRQCAKAKKISKLVVATDDERIFNHVTEFGGIAVMTSAEHPSGTDRCFEAFKVMGEDFDFIINIQGDEPFIEPAQIDELGVMLENPDTEIATLIGPVQSDNELLNPATVKVVLNNKNEAMYFSRQVIPHLRDVNQGEWFKNYQYYKHVGMYGYRKDILEKISKLTPSKLEAAENLEQLRWLENGFMIRCGMTQLETHAVDHPEDISRILKAKGMTE